MRGNSTMSRFALELPQGFLDVIKTEAAARGITMTEFIREICIRPALSSVASQLPTVHSAGRPRGSSKVKSKVMSVRKGTSLGGGDLRSTATTADDHPA